MPTSIGFTGQRADSVTGLDYYVARYYDPTVGQFLSADRVQGNAQGMDPYAYVGGNPESRTDPTGQRAICGDTAYDNCGGDGGGGIANPPVSGCGPCHDPNKPYPGSGGGSTTQPTSNNQQNSTGNGCDARCGTDKILIKNHYTKEKAKTQSMWDAIGDGVSLVGDFLALAADWGNDWADFFFTAVTSLLPHILALVVDITKATGGTPPRWLSDIAGFARVAVAFLNGLRPILRFMDPTAGIFGTIKDWIVHETKHALTEAIGLAIAGVGAPGISAFSKQALEDHYNDINNQVDGYSASVAYQQCQLFYANQNVQC